MQELIWDGGRNRNFSFSFVFEKYLPFKENALHFQIFFFLSTTSLNPKRNCRIKILPGYFHGKIKMWHFLFHSLDLLPACDGERPTLAFLQDVMDILLQYVVKSFDRSTKVIDFHYPNELLQEYNWELADQPQNLEEILMHCQTTLKYAIKTGIVQSKIIKLFFPFTIFILY